MPTVTVLLPTLLSPLVGGRAAIEVEAETVAGVLRGLVGAHPALGVHLFDEAGRLRQHVLCFHNDVNTRWNSADVAVAAGDRVLILQAVSGG